MSGPPTFGSTAAAPPNLAPSYPAERTGAQRVAASGLGVPVFTEEDDLKLLHAALRCHYGDAGDRPRVIRLHRVRDGLIEL